MAAIPRIYERREEVPLVGVYVFMNLLYVIIGSDDLWRLICIRKKGQS